MESDPKPYRPGQWVFLGVVLGAFIGLLVDKFAIGLIFGLLIGIMVDSAKRKSAKGGNQTQADDQGSD